jgi:hypothetical protein
MLVKRLRKPPAFQAATTLSKPQFCVVLQAARETARLMEIGATAEDIANMSVELECDQGL